VPLSWPDTFETRVFATGGAHIHARFSKGLDQQPRALPALLLLHGFPQSHSMWHAVAQHLAAHFLLVVPDLRGYGDSSKAAGLPDHSNYSKRAMAADMVALMDALGVDRFHLCGHDRGASIIRSGSASFAWSTSCRRSTSSKVMACASPTWTWRAIFTTGSTCSSPRRLPKR
jgi:haloacetate dehalogenase